MHDRRDPNTFTGRAFMHSIITRINNATLMHVNTFTHDTLTDEPSSRDETTGGDALTRGDTPSRGQPSTGGEVQKGSTSRETLMGTAINSVEACLTCIFGRKR